MQKLSAHSRRSPKPLASFRTGMPPGLEAVLDRMMAKDPAARHQTPAEVAGALAPFSDSPASAPTVEMSRSSDPLDAEASTRPDLSIAPSSGATKPIPADRFLSDWADLGPIRRPRRPWPPVATAGALLLVGVGLLALIVHRIRTDTGELIIETDDPNVAVVVKQGGRLVTIVDPEVGQTIELRAGDYQVALKGEPSGLQLSTGTVTLTRGGREVVRIRKVAPLGAGYAGRRGAAARPARG